MDYLMGIDVGTTGTKTILMKESGKISRTKPIRENVKVYDDCYKVYRSLYPALTLNFDKINNLIAR